MEKVPCPGLFQGKIHHLHLCRLVLMSQPHCGHWHASSAMVRQHRFCLLLIHSLSFIKLSAKKNSQIELVWLVTNMDLECMQETQTKPEGQIHFFPVLFKGYHLYDVMAERCGSSQNSAPAVPAEIDD